MRSVFALLFLLFHNVIFLSRADSTLTTIEDGPVRSMSSNGEILAVVLPTKILFYSLISKTSQTLLGDLFSMGFDNQVFDQDFTFDFLPDNRFVLCLVDTCRLYKVNPNEKSVQTLFKFDAGYTIKSWSAVLLDNKLLVSLLPSDKLNAVLKSFNLTNGSIIGTVEDYLSVVQEDKVQGFRRGDYTYFISTITEQDFYSIEARAFASNITRTRLTRICNSDDSNDLVTQINIHLACGKEPSDYLQIPAFHFESSFLSTSQERLFVLFNSKENGYLSCSYSMNDVDKYIDSIWDSCQHIENRGDFQDECFVNQKRSACSFTWRRNAAYSNCARFGTGYIKKRLSNCEASTSAQTLNRNGWLENFFPLWGNTENRFSESQTFAGLDENTFMALSQSKALKRIPINRPQQLPLWDKNVDSFITVKSDANHPAHIIYSKNNQVQAQQVTCAALYANCSVLRWDDPLECSYCSFSNSSGYVTQLTGEQNRTCAQADGQVILGQCPPVIYKVTIGGNDVTVVGDHLTSFRDPKVFVCDTECEDAHFQTNAISCKVDDISPACNVRITGSLSSVPEYTVYYDRNQDTVLDRLDNDSTTAQGKSAGRPTKFIVGVVAALFLIAIVGAIGYIITHRKCTHNDVGAPPSKPFTHDFLRGHPYNSIATTELPDPDPEMELYGITAFDDEKLEKIGTIGQGNFSQVYKCRYKDSPDELVAVKEIFDGDFREVKLISRCNHPNIVSYYGYFRQQGKICLVMEYLAGGDLHKYLINMKNHFNCREGFNIVLQIAEGMRYLAANDIIHRDLAARNCIMSEDRRTVKISDFGLCRKTNAGNMYQPVDPRTKLPFRWTSLECIGGEGFNEKSDVWSFGILLWEVFSRARLPYFEIKTNHELEDFLRQGKRLSHPGPGCPEELYEIMTTCWVTEPSNRPTFAQLHATMEQVIGELDSAGDVDYSNVYLTPRASMNEASHSTPTIMDESDVSNFVRERNSTNGHISIT